MAKNISKFITKLRNPINDFIKYNISTTKLHLHISIKIILNVFVSLDPKVKVILVNVFGGIVNCATIAKGIITASRNLKLKIPLVVRLEGNYFRI